MLWGVLNAFYYQNGDIYTFSWIVNSDWMMHLSQVQNFSQLPWWYVATHHPLFAGDILAYPFFVNWFSGMLLFFFGDLVFAMIFPMIVGIIIFLLGIYFLFFVLSQNRVVPVIALFLFFFSGGWQYIDALQLFSWSQWKTLPDYTFDYSSMVPLGYQWKSVFLTTLLPQRSFLWGMGVGTIALSLFFSRFFPLLSSPLEKIFLPFSQLRVLPFLGIGMLFGCVSFLHTHSFIFLFSFLFLFSLFYIRYLAIFLTVGLGAVLTSFPYIWLLLQKQSSVSEISLNALSASGYESLIKNESWIDLFFTYWNANWGLLFWGLLLFLIPFVVRKVFADHNTLSQAVLLKISFITVVLLVLYSVFQMQSNPWDNTKIWLWICLFASFFLASFFYFLWKFSFFTKILACILFCSSLFSGIIMLHSGMNDAPLRFFSVEEQESAKTIAKYIHPSSVVLTSDYFHLPFTALVPKQSFMGYRGWIASYGMNYQHHLDIMKSVFSGSPVALQQVHQYGIDFVLINDSVRSEFTVNDSFFDTHFKKIGTFGSFGMLYEVK